MHIKEIILDGFKSYANKTVVGPFDTSFNAITGLNGTGKSNILDSICFVLGISNLTQVRVRNLQELVYKQGQARVTKATVTIVFDNSDPKTSPVGYEQYKELTVTRQVVIGGRNKYLINGHTAQQNRVQTLFHSVGLNVNNPHFLIMQGRITKVCNMKPPEVLGMIEEAAGTRLYENKKLAALKTIAKKQIKVDEINKILKEEITPTLDKLRKERSSYVQWSSNNTEIERLERFLTAYDFFQAQKTVEEGKGLLDEIKQNLSDLVAEHASLEKSKKEIEKRISAMTQKRQKQMKSDFSKLESDVNSESKELVKHTSVWSHKNNNLESERKTLSEIEGAIVACVRSLQDKQQELQSFEEQVAAVNDEYKKLSEQVNILQSQQLGISMSNDSKDEKGTLANQLMDAQRQVTELEALAESYKIRIAHLNSDVTEKKKSIKATERDFAKLKKSYDKCCGEVEAIDQQLKAMKHSPEEQHRLEMKIRELEESITSLSDERDKLSASLSSLRFEYEAPKGFDKSKVKGFVAELLMVKHSETSTALEVAAGGRLYNVVVDTEQTGKLLLEKGKLKRRVTIIPLNKISARPLEKKVVDSAAKTVGRDNVNLALQLVGYEKDVEAAMQYVFGRTFVCRDSNSAKQVAFSPEVKTQAVTLQGDVYDPRGTLTGGSAPAGGSVLIKLERLNTLESKIKSITEEVQELKAVLADMTSNEEKCRELTNQRELSQHQIALMKTRMDQSDFSQMQKEIDDASAEIDRLQSEIKQAQQSKASMQKKTAELEGSIHDFDNQRKNKAKEIEKEISTGKSKMSALSSQVKSSQMEREKLQLELDSLNDEHKQLEEQKAQSDDKIKELEGEVAALSETVAEKKLAFERVQARLNAEKEKLVEIDEGIGALNEEKVQVVKELDENALEQKKSSLKITTSLAEEKKSKQMLESIVKKHDWIGSEKHLFGKSHTDYDFSAQQPKVARARLEKLKGEQEKLSKKINKKVIGMIEKAEQECDDLRKKRDQIVKDKQKIEQVIEELDIKKNEALETTWKKVNNDLGSIFSTLLPGAHAKLEPPQGLTVLDGLELRVAFGKVWKESLSELSGGQRSLLALSLILSLLLFKPAPMYILDEVDAALDLSHTQNIGQMLKTHFPQSQFVVVSLKEGMFNNANVIFRTKFADGVSAVQRTSNKR